MGTTGPCPVCGGRGLSGVVTIVNGVRTCPPGCHACGKAGEHNTVVVVRPPRGDGGSAGEEQR